jgi:protein-S-isoprenylcysteine O-methyltransferase Ste14
MAVSYNPAYGIELAWLIFLAYWFFSGFCVNRMERAEPAGQRLARLFLMIVAFLFLTENDPHCGVLNRRFIPSTDAAVTAGLISTYAGVFFAIWARSRIGKYWSATVALRANHELIRTGP